MQGVYVRKHVVGFHDLKDLIMRNKNRVYLLTDKGRIKVLTRSQNREILNKQAQMSMLGLGSSRESIIVLEDMISNRAKYQEITKIEGPKDAYTCYIRPKTKKELKKSVAEDPANIYLQATSQFGNDFEGQLSRAPLTGYNVVGPDPQRERSWYAEIKWSDKKNNWIVT